MQTLATIFVYLLYVYFGIGLFFAIFFLVKGIGKIDAGAKDSSWRFRLLMLPGSAAFWPLLLQKWLKASQNNK